MDPSIGQSRTVTTTQTTAPTTPTTPTKPTKPTVPAGRSTTLSSAAPAPEVAGSTSTAVDATEAQTEVARGIELGAIASDREILLHGRRAYHRGDDAGALDSLNRLVAHGAQFADVHYMIGMINERRGDLDAALDQFRDAIRINPSYVEALLALASLHERRGEYERSQGYAERASELSRPTAAGLDPTTRGKLANQQAALADALVEAGERRDAIEQYRGALDRCPTYHDIRHRLAITLREAGLPAQAAQEFQRILRLHSGLLDSQIQLGLTYYSMGRTPDAIREWDAVLEKDPGRDEARMYLRLVSGNLARGQRDEVANPDGKLSSENDDEIAFASVGAVPRAEPLPAPPKAWKTTQLRTRAPLGTDGSNPSEDA